jgi:photosystem II stability/assembly factor-like uncharacterized protein
MVVGTSDGGVSWRVVSSPPTDLEPLGYVGSAGPQVRAVTFADPRNGWLYGPGLWATHDGGEHWTRVTLKLPLDDLVVSGGWAYAEGYNYGKDESSLFRSPIGRDDWRPVAALPTTLTAPPWLLAASGNTVWTVLQRLTSTSEGPAELWRTTDGTHWRQIGEPCPNHLAPLVSIAATSPSDLLLTCGGAVLVSTDGGNRTRSIGPSRAGYSFGPVGAPPGQVQTIVRASPIASATAGLRPPQPGVRSALARTINGGSSWTTTDYSESEVGWADLEFVNSTVGSVIHGCPGCGEDQLLRTTNAGATFTPVTF